MQAFSQIRTNTTTCDARRALAEFLQSVQRLAELSPQSNVFVQIYPHQDASVVRYLAERLPATATHFQGGSSKQSMTAAEFLARGFDWKRAGFFGYLPNSAGALAAAQVFDDALQIADVRFEMTFTNILWRGSPPGWSAAMQVRGTSKKDRKYYLIMDSKGESVASKEEALSAWKQIKLATGLDFARGHLSFFDPSLKNRPDPEIDQAIRSGFAAALAEASNGVAARGLHWRDFRGIKTHEEAFQTRQLAWGSGNSHRIDFDRLVKAFMKREFPEFQSRGGGGGESETLFYSKALTSSASFRLHIDKIYMQGLRKTFELKVGVEFHGVDFRNPIFMEDVFRLFQAPTQLQWTYNTVAEFDAALSGMAHVIRETAPFLESAFRKWLGQLPERVKRQ